jgi:lysophospholipase L1-like esterase
VQNAPPVHAKAFNTTSTLCLSFTLFGCHKGVIGKPYRSYVAIGDSLSEGLGDFTFDLDRHYNGWTDRLACIMAKEAQDAGFEFHYANLALRGSKLEKIMTGQLYKALALQPDLVTVMAGSNDLLSREDSLPRLRASYRDGLQQLLAAGADVVVANTINPLHLRVFKPLRYRAERFSELIEDVAAEFEIPVLDVYGIQNFKELMFWAEDMVHFSGHGHIAVANQAANLLELNYRFPELDPQELAPVSRSLIETASWVKRDVIPFFQRKLKGVTSGDGLDPKHQRLESFTPKVDHPGWELLRL